MMSGGNKKISKNEQSNSQSLPEIEEMWEVEYIHSHQIKQQKIYFRTFWKNTFTTPKDFIINDYWNLMKPEISAIRRTPTKIQIEWKPSVLEPKNFEQDSEILKEYCVENDLSLTDYQNGSFNV